MQQIVRQPAGSAQPALSAGLVNVPNPGSGTTARPSSQVSAQNHHALTAPPSSQLQSPGKGTSASKVGGRAVPASAVDGAKIQKRATGPPAPSCKSLPPTGRAPAAQVGARTEPRPIAPRPENVTVSGITLPSLQQLSAMQTIPLGPQTTTPLAPRPSHAGVEDNECSASSAQSPGGCRNGHASSAIPTANTLSVTPGTVAAATAEKSASRLATPSHGRRTQKKKKAKQVVVIDLTETDAEDDVPPAVACASATVRRNSKSSTEPSRNPSTSRGLQVSAAGDRPKNRSPPPPTSNNVIIGAASVSQAAPLRCVPIAPRPIVPERGQNQNLHDLQDGRKSLNSTESARVVREKKARMDREEGKTMLASKKAGRNKGQAESKKHKAQIIAEVHALQAEALEAGMREKRVLEQPDDDARAKRRRRTAEAERIRRMQHRDQVRDQAESARRNHPSPDMAQCPLSVGEGARRLLERTAAEESRRRAEQRLAGEHRDVRHPHHCPPSGPEKHLQGEGQKRVSEAQIQRLLSGTPSDEHRARELAETEARRAERLREEAEGLRELQFREDNHHVEGGEYDAKHRAAREKADNGLGNYIVGLEDRRMYVRMEARRLEQLRVQMETRRAEQIREEQSAKQKKTAAAAEAAAQEACRVELLRQKEKAERKKAEAAAQEARRAEQVRERQKAEKEKAEAAAREARRVEQLRKEQEAERKRIEVAKACRAPASVG